MGLHCRIVTNPTYLLDVCMEVFRNVWDYLKVHEIIIGSQTELCFRYFVRCISNEDLLFLGSHSCL
jgi:hypothetical protein